MSKSKVHSHHIFICPFRIDDTSFNLKDYNPKGDWLPFNFEINEASDYNERVYFYDFVYDALFEENKENRPLKQFYIDGRIDQNTSMFYNIKYLAESGEGSNSEYKIYSLSIDEITLNVYETGIAVLAFHLNNCDFANIEDIKRINDVGRRTYPQFLIEDEGAIKIQEGKFIPSAISISKKKIESLEEWQKTENHIVQEDFESVNEKYERFKATTKDEILLPNTISHFLFDDSKKHLYCPLIDDRMFVISYIGSKLIADIIFSDSDKKEELKTDVKPIWMDSEDWYNLAFCDYSINASHNNNRLRARLNKEHTYDRWEGYQTLFGVTRNSFIALTKGSEFADYIRTHTMTMYFQMVQLCLVQRASILKFSSDASKLAGEIDTHVDESDQQKLKNLQISYIRFMNRLHFREVTAQEQGIELYTMLQEKMRIPDQLKELDDEITEMVSLANMLKIQEDNRVLKRLTNVATIFLIPTLITGFLGVNIIEWGSITSSPWNIIGWMAFILLGISCVCVAVFGFKSLTITNQGNKDTLYEFIRLFLYMTIGAVVTMTILKFK